MYMQDAVSGVLEYKITKRGFLFFFLLFRDRQACGICSLMRDTKQEARNVVKRKIPQIHSGREKLQIHDLVVIQVKNTFESPIFQLIPHTHAAIWPFSLSSPRHLQSLDVIKYLEGADSPLGDVSKERTFLPVLPEWLCCCLLA